MPNPFFVYPYTEWLLRRMALKKSSIQRPFNYEDSDSECHGHGCYREDCCQGFGHHIANRYDNFDKGKVPSKDYSLLRHFKNRWRL